MYQKQANKDHQNIHPSRQRAFMPVDSYPFDNRGRSFRATASVRYNQGVNHESQRGNGPPYQHSQAQNHIQRTNRQSNGNNGRGIPILGKRYTDIPNNGIQRRQQSQRKLQRFVDPKDYNRGERNYGMKLDSRLEPKRQRNYNQ